jgi:hypothetical protein
MKLQDPAFIYETMQLCEDCYSVMKEIITLMKNKKKDRDQDHMMIPS